jgi:hypothetical protein
MPIIAISMLRILIAGFREKTHGSSWLDEGEIARQAYKPAAKAQRAIFGVLSEAPRKGDNRENGTRNVVKILSIGLGGLQSREPISQFAHRV